LLHCDDLRRRHLDVSSARTSLLDNLSFSGETPTLAGFRPAIPIGTVAYTGISNTAGEARDRETTIPAAIKRVMIAVFAIYLTPALVALSALLVECVGGEVPDRARGQAGGWRLRERPDHRRRVGWAASAQRHDALRQDHGEGARGAPVPRHHRVRRSEQ
jgi:hypothetical protein